MERTPDGHVVVEHHRTTPRDRAEPADGRAVDRLRAGDL